MSVTVLISTVSDEFRPYRDALRADLERHNVHVKVQEDFKNLGGDTLDKLDVYIAHCDAVVHLVGDMKGSCPDAREQAALLVKYPDIAKELPPLGEALKCGAAISYTQWEAWLALYHGKLLLIAKAADGAERGPAYAKPADKGAAQIEHLSRLEAVKRYPGCTFENPADLAKHIAYTAILDLLVKDYAEKAARERDVAEGFIHEMAARVAGDRNLDLDGKKQAVRNAIEIYEKEIAGGLTQTNFGEIVDKALASAKAQVDKGQSALARATLRKAAEELQRDEKERRAAYVAGVTELYNRARDIALASYDGEAAAEAVTALTGAVHGADRAGVFKALSAETKALWEYGRDKGSNVHLVAAIAVSRKLLDTASSEDERGAAHVWLGLALWTLGERESGTARLEEAVAADRAALEEYRRERVPLDWAMTQNNLGLALWRLGERESGTARLDEAVTAFREALEEWTRERVPLAWAMTQNNLGNALALLGMRESGTARLDEAVAAYRAALEERTRERVPLDWAQTQNNLGAALRALGERESETARLDEAVAAYRAALEEWTRERVPLNWAGTQNNLGLALQNLGERESGTARLDEAVLAYREALEERTRERVPLDWAATQNNLGGALYSLGERESGTARLEDAVAAYREALKERTPEAAPYWHDQTQQNLANCLVVLEQRRKP
ncbi:MAG: tetratricopeptide repeat protein [Methylocystis sp.]